MPPSTLLIVGSGPGIALQSALLFASKGFTRIALISRSRSNLTSISSQLTSTHPTATVSTHACDVADTQSLTSALAAVESALSGAPEVILFNAAHVSPSTLGTEPASRLILDFATTTAALYTVATTLLPKMSDSAGKPTLLVSGGHIHAMPFPPFFSLSVSKASQFNLSGSLAQVYGDVHVGTCVVNGIVEGEEGEMGSKTIAESLWGLYEGGGKRGEMSVSEVGTVEGFLRKIGVLT